MDDLQQLICGADLERWRIENGFTQGAAAHAFGLQSNKWWQLTRVKSGEPITDPVLSMLLYIYRKYPASVPIQSPENIKEFYEYLGLKDTVQDREKFAELIGRSKPTAYRLLLNDGNPSKPVLRWTEAVLRLNLTPQESLKLMTKVVSNVGFHQVAEEDDED